jgi:MOSC domain-containing protein YiiM
MTGTIEAIYVAAHAREEQKSLDHVELVAGAGIVGDRNYGDKALQRGTNVTLIEAEEIERFNASHGARAPLYATRRNIVTRGVRLNDLVGKDFMIGSVRAHGVELCEPCRILGRNLSTPSVDIAGVVRAFVHRAGLRADLLSSGEVQVGDPIVEAAPAEADAQGSASSRNS